MLERCNLSFYIPNTLLTFSHLFSHFILKLYILCIYYLTLIAWLCSVLVFDVMLLCCILIVPLG